MRRRRGNFGVLGFRGVDPDQCGYLRARFVGPGELIYINGSNAAVTYPVMMWQPVSNAPFDCDLEVAVIDKAGPHALVFPCRRVVGGWINARSNVRIDVSPTHWRLWPQPG